jgi:acyl carrier protein
MTVDVKRTVVKILNDYSEVQYSVDSLNPSLTLEQLQLDSLDVLELIYALEEEFGTELEASELKHLNTVAELVTTFEQHLGRAA